MKLLEIQNATLGGMTVHWTNEGYEVIHDRIGQWLVRYNPNAHCIGLTWADGRTMNGKPSEFFVKTFPIATAPTEGQWDDYEKPSPFVETVLSGGHYINSAYARIPEPLHRRPKGEHHRNGTCAAEYGLCGTCYTLQQKWHERVACEIARTTPPKPGEKYGEYFRRVRGRLLDTWCDAAAAAMKLSKA